MATGKIRADSGFARPRPRTKSHARTRTRHPPRAQTSARARYPRARLARGYARIPAKRWRTAGRDPDGGRRCGEGRLGRRRASMGLERRWRTGLLEQGGCLGSRWPAGRCAPRTEQPCSSAVDSTPAATGSSAAAVIWTPTVARSSSIVAGSSIAPPNRPPTPLDWPPPPRDEALRPPNRPPTLPDRVAGRGRAGSGRGSKRPQGKLARWGEERRGKRAMWGASGELGERRRGEENERIWRARGNSGGWVWELGWETLECEFIYLFHIGPICQCWFGGFAGADMPFCYPWSFARWA